MRLMQSSMQLFVAAANGRSDEMLELMNEGADKEYKEPVRLMFSFRDSMICFPPCMCDLYVSA